MIWSGHPLACRRGADTHRDGDGEREGDADDYQLKRVERLAPENLSDRELALQAGDAQVAPSHPSEPLRVLDEQRPIEGPRQRHEAEGLARVRGAQRRRNIRPATP